VDLVSARVGQGAHRSAWADSQWMATLESPYGRSAPFCPGARRADPESVAARFRRAYPLAATGLQPIRGRVLPFRALVLLEKLVGTPGFEPGTP
jgi:hypothetical protein